MEKNIYVSMLLEMYGKLLTAKQTDIVDLYYNQNLSLAEIAENLNITRQGVRKILMDAESKLIDIEEKLGFFKEKNIKKEELEKIIQMTSEENVKKRLANLL